MKRRGGNLKNEGVGKRKKADESKSRKNGEGKIDRKRERI